MLTSIMGFVMHSMQQPPFRAAVLQKPLIETNSN